MNNMTTRPDRAAARAYARSHLDELAANVLHWRKTGALPHNSQMHQLAKHCMSYASAGDEFQEAERLTIHLALEHAAQTPESLSDTGSLRVVVPTPSTDEAAYDALLPKLVELCGSIETLSEVEYKSWINALPPEQFIEWIRLTTEATTFNAALHDARDQRSRQTTPNRNHPNGR
ncbi:hypothetical protein [Pseudomonas guariconensis]|uniref:hypothetical protein n=1 Tax=Pseudomonas guariconensis TaxID=1288410 RepID=UPI003906864E